MVIAAVAALVLVTAVGAYAAVRAADGAKGDADAAPELTTVAAGPGLRHPTEFPILSAASGTVAWRAYGGGGDCLLGATAVVELTTDGGSTWSRAPEGDTAIHEVLALASESATTAAMIATTGSDCTVRALRTTTGGTSWSETPTPDALPYVDPQDPGRLVFAGAAIAAPCPVARQVAAVHDTVLVLCATGGAWYRDSAATPAISRAEWTALEVSPSRSVLAIGGSPTGFGLALAGYGCPWVPGAATELPYVEVGNSCVHPIHGVPASLALAAAGPDLWIQNDGVTSIVPRSSLH